MRKLEAEIHTLTYEQLAILANYMGNHEIYGFSLEETDKLKKTDVIKNIYKMGKQGILSVEEEKFLVKMPYSKIVAQIEEAKRIMIISSKSDKISEKCCYMGKEILVSQVSVIKDKAIAFRFISQQEILSLLEEENYLPPILEDMEPLKTKINMSQELENVPKPAMSAKEVSGLAYVTLVLTFRNKRKDNEEDWIAVLEKPLGYQIAVKRYGGLQIFSYSKLILEEQIKLFHQEGKVAL